MPDDLNPIVSEWRPPPRVAPIRVRPKPDDQKPLAALLFAFALAFALSLAFGGWLPAGAILVAFVLAVHVGNGFGGLPKLPRVALDISSDGRIPVKISYMRSGEFLGVDHGYLLLIGSWLTFEGERSRFSLSPDDAALGRTGWRTAGGVHLLEGKRRPFHIAIEESPYQERARGSIFDLLADWRSSGLVEGISVFPPDTKDATMRQRERRTKGTLAALLGSGAIALLLSPMNGATAFWVVVLSVGAIICGRGAVQP